MYRSRMVSLYALLVLTLTFVAGNGGMFRNLVVQTTAAQSITAVEWHVAPNGSDDNDGSAAAPFASPQKAFDAVQPGETVVINAGTYNVDKALELHNKQGTAAQPILVRGEGMPILKVTNQDDIAVWRGLIDIVDSSYLTVQGVRLENSGWFGFKVEGGNNITLEENETFISLASAIYTSETTDVQIVRNDVSRFCDIGEYVRTSTCQEGISVVKTDGFEVGWNKVHSSPQGKNLKPGGGEGIDIKEGSKNGMVHHNEVYDLPQIGIYVDAWDRLTENIDVYANRIYRTASGMVVGAENGGTVRNVSVYNNVIYDNGYHGIIISKVSKDGPRENIHIYNNTVVNNGYTENKPPWCTLWGCNNWGYGLRLETTAASNVSIHDNIFTDNVSAPVFVEYGAESKVSINTNLMYPEGAEDRALKGNNPIIEEPNFVDAVARNYRLGVGSPAIGVGIGGESLNVDIDGNPRDPNALDLGAYAFQGTASPNPTPTPTPPVYLPMIESLTLINADTNQPIAEYDPIPAEVTLDLSTLPALSVRANAGKTPIGSVQFVLNGEVTHTENYAPYAIAGDNAEGFIAWTPPVGEHTLTVIPYTQLNGQGDAGETITINLTVTE